MIEDFIDYQYKKTLKFRLCTCSNKHVYTVGDTCKLCNKKIIYKLIKVIISHYNLINYLCG